MNTHNLGIMPILVVVVLSLLIVGGCGKGEEVSHQINDVKMEMDWEKEEEKEKWEQEFEKEMQHLEREFAEEMQQLEEKKQQDIAVDEGQPICGSVGSQHRLG